MKSIKAFRFKACFFILNKNKSLPNLKLHAKSTLIIIVAL